MELGEPSKEAAQLSDISLIRAITFPGFTSQELQESPSSEGVEPLRLVKTSVPFSGVNPDFYNWNRMEVRYCNGASFTGDVEGVDAATNLHFPRIFKAMVDELLAMGMSSADRVILTGGSAGG